MKPSEAIEKVKHLKNFLMVYEDIHQVTLMTDSDKEAIDTVVSHLAHLNTANKKGLDDNLQEKSIEQPDSQKDISNKKDRLYTAKDMEDFAEWVDNHHTVEVRTGKQLRELWEQERGEK